MMPPVPPGDIENRREQLRQRLDVAAKAVADAWQAAVDLFLAVSSIPPPVVPDGQGPPSQSTETMTSQEAADYLGIKVQTLHVWRCTQRYPLPFVKVGRMVRYRKSDLEAFLRRQTKDFGTADSP